MVRGARSASRSSVAQTVDVAVRIDKKRDREVEENEEQDDRGTISQYELERLERIKRNEAFMASLSFTSLKAPSSPVVRKPSPAKRPRDSKSKAVPSRASRRLRGDPANPADLVALPGTWISSLAGTTSKTSSALSSVRHDYGPELTAEEAEIKLEVLKGQIDARDDGKAGTASYEHCLYRVRTMNNAALGRRVRTIERARGAKAKEKMLVFCQVLRDEGKPEELLEMADAALDRLVRGVPLPDTR
ncbi:unnamed protein product [Scytosiphon promiscuus]